MGGGVSETLAFAETPGSAMLVAVTVTVCAPRTEAGAVYRPAAEMLPTTGLSDHVTPVFDVPETAALNACDCEAARVTLAGVSAIVGAATA
jgi:hypothetical protein